MVDDSSAETGGINSKSILISTHEQSEEVNWRRMSKRKHISDQQQWQQQSVQIEENIAKLKNDDNDSLPYSIRMDLIEEIKQDEQKT